MLGSEISEISEGNIAKWHYEEQIHWLIAHNLWGLIPGDDPLDAECHVAIKMFPKNLKDVEQWVSEHNEEMRRILEIVGTSPVSGIGSIILFHDNNVEVML